MIFHCHFEGCGKAFPRKGKLADHLNMHTNTRPYKCDMCDKAYMKNSHLTSHKKNHFPPELKCERCGYMCHTSDRMHKHRQTCLEYRCSTCGKKYVRRAWFDAHVEGHHVKFFNKKPKYVCEHCKFEFSKKSNLTAHVRSVHHMLRPFKCLCGKQYAHSASLNNHRRKCSQVQLQADVHPGHQDA